MRSLQPESQECMVAITADIGGTNARFSCVDLNTLTVDKIAVFPCEHFPNLKEALIYYRTLSQLEDIKLAAIAVACPVVSDEIILTNSPWHFSVKQLKTELELDTLHVLNDIAAAAISLPNLSSDGKVQIGSGTPNLSKPMVMLGVGTGLGEAYLIPSLSGMIPLSGEGGHTSWAAQNEQEWFIQRFLDNQFGRVSWERLLSGPGLENLYLAIAAYRQIDVSALSASEIIKLAVDNDDPLALAVIEQFFASLGQYAGDLALRLCAFGGVYIAGGVVPKLLAFMGRNEFRYRFESKGRFSDLIRQIPTYVITAEQPALIGAALYLKQIMKGGDNDVK